MPAVKFRRALRGVLFVVPLLAVVSWGVVPSARAMSPEAAGAFVGSLSKRTIEIRSAGSYTDEERRGLYRGLLREGFAVKIIGRFALGRYWRVATPEMRREYLFLFQGFMLETYAKKLDGLLGKTVVIVKSQPINKTDVMVISEISGDGSTVRVDYRVRLLNGDLKVIDVLVEGISLIVTQRAEFASVIGRNGLDGLMAELRKYAKK